MTWNQNTSNSAWGASSSPAIQGSSPWDGFEEVEARKAKNDYLPAGLNTYAEVVELKVVQSMKNPGQTVFVAVLKIEDDASIVRCYDWVAKLSERAYLMAIKSLVCSLNPDADPSSFGKEAMDHITSQDQPCAGLKVHVRTEQITTQRGNLFTKVWWSPSH